MKILSKRKQNEILWLLASIVACTQKGDAPMHLEKIYDNILDIALNIGGTDGMNELVALTEAINYRTNLASDMFLNPLRRF